jgi:hypothetical protein
MMTVYQFEAWNIAGGDWVTSAGKATAKFIESQNGRIIPGTAEDVPSAEIDGDGRRIPPRSRHS